MEFRSLASGSGGNCYLATAPGAAPLLIECGLSYPQIAVALGHRVTALAGCCVSHGHQDHCKAAVRLAGMGVDVFGSEETLMALYGPHSHRMHTLTPKQETAVGPWRVLPFEAVHDCPGTLGFLVGAPDGDRLLFLTDSAYAPYRFDGLTMVAIEANWSEELLRAGTASGAVHPSRFSRTVRSHMSIEQALVLLSKNDLSKCREIVLLHLSDQNSSAEEFRRRVEQATGVPCRVADAKGGD